VVVGVLTVSIWMSEPLSLKDKRSIIKRIITKIQNQFHVSAAEVGHLDEWKNSILGVSCVSNESGHCDRIMQSIIRSLENDYRVDIIEVNTELIHIR
jgi:uncharacterized protein YlxP (DUF503 family)